jgi:hypothetical protein
MKREFHPLRNLRYKFTRVLQSEARAQSEYAAMAVVSQQSTSFATRSATYGPKQLVRFDDMLARVLCSDSESP